MRKSEENPSVAASPVPSRESTSRRHSIARRTRHLPVHAIVAAIAVLWLAPTLALLVSSFRERTAVTATGWWRILWNPADITLQNYADVLTQNNMARSFVNSIIIAVPGTLLPIFVAAVAAYAFAWMRFPGRRLVLVLVIALLVVPIQVTIIPVLRLFTLVHLAGTFPAIWLAHTGYGLPFAIFLLHSFFSQLPRPMLESAFLDGASDIAVFFKVILPLSTPAIASLAIFQFLWVWNDLLVALVYLQDPQKAPLTLTLTNLVSSYGSQWQLLTAGAFVSMALPLIIFFSLQRYFVRGILAGSVKE